MELPWTELLKTCRRLIFMRILYMKKKTFVVFAFVFVILFFQTGSFGAEDTPPNSPSVFVPENRFKFDPVLDGTEITHDFIVQNKGTAPLKIEKVRSG